MNDLQLGIRFLERSDRDERSSVECFFNQKDLSQFPKLLSRYQPFSFCQRYKVLMSTMVVLVEHVWKR